MRKLEIKRPLKSYLLSTAIFLLFGRRLFVGFPWEEAFKGPNLFILFFPLFFGAELLYQIINPKLVEINGGYFYYRGGLLRHRKYVLSEIEGVEFVNKRLIPKLYLVKKDASKFRLDSWLLTEFDQQEIKKAIEGER